MLRIVATFAVLLTVTALAQQPKKDPTAPSVAEKKAIADYEAALVEASNTYNAAATRAHKRLANVLEEELKAATKAGDFDRATAIRERMKQLEEDGAPIIPTASGSIDSRPGIVAGTWKIEYNNGNSRTYRIAASGHVELEGKKILLKPAGKSWVLDAKDNKIERLTFASNRLFVEHFNPAQTYPTKPAAIGYGMQAK